MNGMNININTTSEVFFRQLVELLSSFSPVKGLRNKELNVLAEVMKQNYLNKNLKEHIRRNFVFSQETKQLMSENLNISRDALNTNLSVLKRKKIMTGDKILIKPLQIYPDKEFTFTITFKLKDE
jgi:hypothetical protein